MLILWMVSESKGTFVKNGYSSKYIDSSHTYIMINF